jgi:predicted  nucleic acid-binding Zn-ribbon protein
MNITQRLYEYQEIDLEIESKHLKIKEMTAKLGESQSLIDARARLAEAQKQMDALLKEQRSLETDIDDLTGKLKAAEKDLYSGRIRVPKELSSLQQDIELLKNRRTQLEDKALEIMEKVELYREKVEQASGELSRIESAWLSGQKKLEHDLEATKIDLAILVKRQQEAVAGIDATSLELYRSLRKQRGTAVARVEQGICRGCRISLPVSELQLVRSGQLVQCSSCGRILYLP